eukprot:3494262-Rhodomonas_salina.7
MSVCISKLRDSSGSSGIDAPEDRGHNNYNRNGSNAFRTNRTRLPGQHPSTGGEVKPGSSCRLGLVPHFCTRRRRPCLSAVPRSSIRVDL